ncbi:TPA: hypothetical protein ACWQSC_004198 [Salmonella enterica]|uniref:Uncharacterized protein n=8 Tax=Salmonella enterica TaxID=28901 RepID=A0A5U2FSM2_SALER|nr:MULTISPECIES: hypothetical protein [Salmonella]EAA0714016.1 hypothetical protein [Salmonella enterica subsp. enterica serovar Stanley]EAA3655479.1 hypothetical protein [Salmonella enterica subsp. enterica serovar Saintpaul]EAA7025897.1 hypothetical protein [Salmonella enterica subsp. enterica serovar Uganda]EBG2998153.1 hypothetical protein [Salmonella enterica subsp. enterica serovar Corvallis]EBH8173813.1 hypothetical protein [Salmonella enterica subsp. enterica serovar Typhimurium str. U
MKAKYATLIRSLLRTYREQASAIEKESFSVHSDGIQLMELNLKLAKCLEGMSLMARFNNEFEDYCELHEITMMAFNGSIPVDDNIPGLISLASCTVKNNKSAVQLTAVKR